MIYHCALEYDALGKFKYILIYGNVISGLDNFLNYLVNSICKIKLLLLHNVIK